MLIKAATSRIVIVILIIVFKVSTLTNYVRTNVGSLTITQGLLGEKYMYSPAKIRRVLADHPRGQLWTIQWAVQRGEWLEILDYFENQLSQEKQDDLLLISSVGTAAYQLGDVSLALSLWLQSGNYQALIALADESTLKGDTSTTMTALNMAYALFPERATTRFAKALIFVERDYEHAVLVLKTSLATFPNSLYGRVWWRYLGDAYFAQEMWLDAQDAYKEALVQNTNDWAAQIGLGWVLYRLGGEKIDVVTMFQKAIETDPKQGDAYYALAQLYTEEGDISRADQWYRLALQHRPDKFAWYVSWAQALHEAGKIDAALVIYEDIATQFPDSDVAHYLVFQVSMELQHYDKAEQAIERAIAVTPEPNQIYFLQAAMLYERLEKYEQAIVMYRQVMMLEPDNIKAITALEHLKHHE